MLIIEVDTITRKSMV